jgi:hypothetical protein
VVLFQQAETRRASRHFQLLPMESDMADFALSLAVTACGVFLIAAFLI